MVWPLPQTVSTRVDVLGPEDTDGFPFECRSQKWDRAWCGLPGVFLGKRVLSCLHGAFLLHPLPQRFRAMSRYITLWFLWTPECSLPLIFHKLPMGPARAADGCNL